MTDDESRRALRDLLAELSDVELRVMCVEALRRWRTKRGPYSWQDPIWTPDYETFSMHGDFGPHVLSLLAERKGTKLRDDEVQVMKERFGDGLSNEWMTGVAEFVWWLIRAGLAVDTERTAKRFYPQKLRLTRRGVSWLSSTEADDPLLPGFLDRIRVRCPALPEGVVSLLVDARACLDHTLHRPAVVLMGVAYELAIETVVGELVNKNLLPSGSGDKLPAEKIARVKTFIAGPDVKHILTESDEVRAASAAYDFADTLRLRRNDAAHTTPAFDFSHRSETEEFLISAGRHLPGIWSLAR